jgi:hypothetical protein
MQGPLPSSPFMAGWGLPAPHLCAHPCARAFS